jgi:xylan 1,4-beta-xylosidase
MNRRARSPWIAAGLCLLLGGHARADLQFSGREPGGIQAVGGQIVGKLAAEAGQASGGLRLGEDACLTFPTAGNFQAGQGSVSFRVQPLWNGDDGRDHAFFHLGDGNAHCTVFKTAAGTLRFVYKPSPSRYCAADVDATGWKAGQWHQVTAGWLPTYSGDLLLVLDVDGRRATRAGAVPLDEVPELLYVGRRGPRVQPADAVIDDFRLTAAAPEVPYATGPKADVVATVDVSADRPFRRVHDFTTIWNSRDNPLPFDVGDPYYRRFVEAGFTMARLVAFSESWLWGTRVELDDAGRLTTDFTDFDRLLDVMLSAGAEPYVRLAYHTPSALVDPDLPREERGYALPQDLGKWDDLIERIVRHVRSERKLPVRYWVASLNEGDIPVRRGAADPETIYRLYERTARLVKRIDPQAKVGGPALAWSVGDDGRPAEMLDGFLGYCREHDLPLDFICFHGYNKAHPREFESLIDAVRGAAERHCPERAPRLEYFLDEWSLWRRDGSQDNEYGASYLAAALQYQRRAGLTKSSIVSFNHFRDVPGGPGVKPFVYNDQAIDRLAGLPLVKGPVVTAPYFVWRMHNRLAGRELAVDLPGRDGILEDDSGGLTATADGDHVAMLLWHFDLMRNAGRRWTVRLENLPEPLSSATTLRVVEYRIDHDHTNPYTDYVLKGKDSHEGRYNLESGSLDKVRDERLSPGRDGVSVEIELPNLSVALVEISSFTASPAASAR